MDFFLGGPLSIGYLIGFLPFDCIGFVGSEMELSESDSGAWDALIGCGASTSTPTSTSRKSKMWPPGFRFHPTDEELVLYYLKWKVCHRRLKPNMIGETDVYKCEPWDLPDKSLLQTGDKQWYFFSARDRKYPNGARSNRGTKCGYWKATGKDRCISHNSRSVGMKKTLVFYKGRAPKGERTNWVMHEYTINKEEFKNCRTVQDSFALYKVYEKSGSGPKNGEQYGAPFREEEWLEDDPVDDDLGNLISRENMSPQSEFTDGFDQHLPDDMEEILRQIADDPDLNQHNVGSSYAPVVDCEEGGMQSPVVMRLPEEAISAEISELSQPCKYVDAESGFQVAQSANSLMQPPEVPEVASARDWVEQGPYGNNGDYMELNDLSVPISDILKFGVMSNESSFPSGVGSYDYDDRYFDALMFQPEEIVPPEGTHAQPFFDNFSSVVVDHQLLPSYDDENQYLEPHVTTQLWGHEQKFNVVSTTGSSQVVLPPSASGVIRDGNLVNTHGGMQTQVGSRVDASEPWFTSAISTLLESIPTNPASASENALISRALERMSSFGSIRIRPTNTGVAADVDTAIRRRDGRNGGILFISFLGALWAVLWVLMIGTAVKVFKAFFGRFVAS